MNGPPLSSSHFAQFDNSYFYDGECKTEIRELIREAGAHRATLLGGWALFARNPDGSYDIETGFSEEIIKKNMPVQIGSGPPPYVLNIEHQFDWPLSRDVCDERFQFVRNQIAEAVNWVHRFRPDARTGVYAHFPRVDYRVRPWLIRNPWAAVKKAYTEYLDKNQHLALYLQDLDFCAPSVYPGVYPNPTADPNPMPFLDTLANGAFEELVNLQCDTARRVYGKPAYAYIQCRDFPRELLNEQHTQQYLDIVRRHADGAILWTTPGMLPQGKDTPWFQVYLQWVRENHEWIPGPSLSNDPESRDFSNACSPNDPPQSDEFDDETTDEPSLGSSQLPTGQPT